MRSLCSGIACQRVYITYVLRYISCLNTKESSNHVLHTLDALHNSCIEKSKKQFVENRLIDLINVHHEESNEEIRTKVNEMTPPNFMTMGLLVPEVDLIFLQVSCSVSVSVT